MNTLEERKLLGALIGVARTAESNEPNEETDTLLIESLLADMLHLDGNEQCEKLWAEKNRLSPQCAFCASPCGHNADYDWLDWDESSKEVQQMKTAVWLLLKGIAVTLHAQQNARLMQFLYRGLFVMGENVSQERLAALLREAGEIAMNP